MNSLKFPRRHKTLRPIFRTIDGFGQSYSGIKDKLFEPEFTSLAHPEIAKIQFEFRQRAHLDPLYTQVSIDLKNSKTKATRATAFWLEFSRQIPKVLSTLASKCESNLARHFMIQAAFEELGGRNRCHIHCDLFVQCLRQAGSESEVLETHSEIFKNRIFTDLIEYASSCGNDQQIFGFAAGLELYANENINLVKVGAQKCAKFSEAVDRSEFFIIHDTVENEHIRSTLANYIRFCKTNVEKNNFVWAFDKSIDFWRRFWAASIQNAK